jgi:hypothetical protein
MSAAAGHNKKVPIDMGMIKDIADDDRVTIQINDKPAVNSMVGYIPVKLTGSGGRLSAPPILHVRNYSFDEATQLARATEENFDETIIRVLTDMNYEKFDCGMLHREELKEMLLTIHAAFWGRTFEGYYYIVDDTKPLTPENRSVASLPISSLNFHELSSDFKEPIVVIDPSSKIEIGFTLPRMINGIIADRWIDERYGGEDASFSELRYVISQNEHRSADAQLSYDAKQLKDYLNLQERIYVDRARLLQALQIYEVNGVVLSTLEERLHTLSESMAIFSRYIGWRNKNAIFGLDPEVTFECSITHKMITRRFPFRCFDLVPPMDDVRDQGYTVSFGRTVSLV